MKGKVSYSVLVDDSDLDMDSEGLRKALLKEIGGRGRATTARKTGKHRVAADSAKGALDAKAAPDKGTLERIGAAASTLSSIIGSLLGAMQNQEEMIREMRRIVEDINGAVEGQARI